jgi:hypothetical protein
VGSSVPDRHPKTFDGDGCVKKDGRTREGEGRNSEKGSPAVWGPARTRRKEVETKGGDTARKDTCQHAGNDTSRRECLCKTIKKQNKRKPEDHTRGKVSMPEDLP